MNTYRTRGIRFALLAAGLVGPFAAAASTVTPPRPLAIRAAAVPAEPAPGWSPAATAKSRRTGWVELDLSAIQARRSPQAARFAAGGVVDLELFPGERHRFRGRLVEDGVGGASTWIGALESPTDDGHAVLTLANEAFHGVVEVGTARYVIASASPGSVRVREVDPQAEGRCLMNHDRGADRPRPVRSTTTYSSASSSTATIDLLVLYTGAVAGSYGDPAAMVSNLAASTNVAFYTSGIDAAVRIVHYAQVSHSDPETTQSWLDTVAAMQAGTGGFSSLATLRNTHAADLVGLITESGESTALCGVAGNENDLPLEGWEMAEPGTPDHKAFFAVTADCSAGDLTFTHEIGHLLGGWHDADHTGDNCGIDQWSCGFRRATSPTFRTVMSSNWSDLACAVGGCPRITRFSNYADTVTISSTAFALGRTFNPAGPTNDAFAFTLDTTAPYVSGHRTPSASAPGAPGYPSISTCYSYHNVMWSGSSGTVGWYEVEVDTSTSFSSPSLMYRGSFDWVDINFGGSTFYLRVRGCNSNACGSWSTSGLNDPNYCI